MKKIVCFILVITIVSMCSVPAFAHGKEEHDRLMEKVLFGDETFKKNYSEKDERYKRIEDLEYAVALSIDQYNNNSKSYLGYLQSRGIHGLPKSIGEMNYGGDVNKHRSFTHLGWDYPYLEENLKKWNIRKEILLQTTNSVFGFQRVAGKWISILDFKYDEQCEAFAKFIYYVHILGDYKATKEPKEIIGQVIPIVRNHPGDGNEDIIFELQENTLPVMLKSSIGVNKTLYNSLLQDLSTISKEGRALGGENHIKENFSDYKQLATTLLKKLESKMSTLLKDEPFFRKAFYD